MDVWIECDDASEHVAHLRFDFGELNILSPSAIDDLAATVEEVPDDVSVVTIRGVSDDPEAIGGLTGGLDLESVREYEPAEARALIGRLQESMQRVRDLRAVTICGCGEFALGAGLELAMSCDFRIATEDSIIGLPEINVGLVTGIQGGLLIRLVGLQAAKELIFTGESISGSRAEMLGLVNHAVPATDYEATFKELVNTLSAKRPRILKWQADVFRALRSNGVEAGIDSSQETIAMCFGTSDQREAMTAFLDDE